MLGGDLLPGSRLPRLVFVQMQSDCSIIPSRSITMPRWRLGSTGELVELGVQTTQEVVEQFFNRSNHSFVEKRYSVYGFCKQRLRCSQISKAFCEPIRVVSRGTICETHLNASQTDRCSTSSVRAFADSSSKTVSSPLHAAAYGQGSDGTCNNAYTALGDLRRGM